MAMHSMRRPHEEERPCFVCRKPTKALNHGVLEHHPRCDECKSRLSEEFSRARTQQRKQDQAIRSKGRNPSGPAPAGE